MSIQLQDTVQNSAALTGRILLALIFITSGFGKITGYEGTAAYMAGAGLPLVNVLLPLVILIELGGGLAIAFGWKTRWAAAAIFLFLIPTTVLFHAYWAVPADQVMMQQINFWKNVSIMGGMLAVVAFGAGAWAFDKTPARPQGSQA
jgi:putative oxidoreductase